MKLYVAGPMRGYPLFNFPAFDAATEELRKRGHEVISPAELDRQVGFDETSGSLEGFDFHAAMRRDIEALLEVDGIALLPGWRRSSGVATELAVARALGLRVWRYVAAGLLHEAAA